MRNMRRSISIAPATTEWTLTPWCRIDGVAAERRRGDSSSSGSTDYQYVVTAVNPNDGTESDRVQHRRDQSAVDIAATAGLSPSHGTLRRRPESTNITSIRRRRNSKPRCRLALFGYAGSAYGTQFLDPNIVADYSQVPPTHQNPFARGQIRRRPTLYRRGLRASSPRSIR